MLMINLHRKMERSYDTLKDLEFILRDLRVNTKRPEEEDTVENFVLRDNHKIIRASYIPPCKLVPNEPFKIPVPTKKELECEDNGMMSVADAMAYSVIAKEEAVKKAAKFVLQKVNDEMKKDIEENPYQVQFSYEMSLAGIVTNNLVREVNLKIAKDLANNGYQNIKVNYIDKIAPMTVISFSLV